ncbi:MAG: dTDP-4-dehydrorhamnose reductase [Prevotellaceae bacterium]|jgi:dTDP-4-dehydrorhamnose reductase|nr:dTDP-4-dehydrorhamnose reductase [Prevotellaceae bacterium]
MKKILVTGANGQLGSELKKLSKNVKFDFVFTDVDELDITDIQECAIFFDKVKPDFVINCAAYTAVDKAEADKQLAWKINVDAVKNLVISCSLHDSYLIQISTDYVFDGKSYVPYIEKDLVAPLSEYGKSKAAAELEVLSYPKSLVIRTSWLYSTCGNNFVKTMIRLGQERESLNVVFDQLGTPTYAEDLAATILEIAAKIDSGEKRFVAGLFHYSNEGVCSWYDFACAIMKLNSLKCKIYPIETSDYPTPAKRPKYGVMNKAKIKSIYEININHWYSSLEKMMNVLSQKKTTEVETTE